MPENPSEAQEYLNAHRGSSDPETLRNLEACRKFLSDRHRAGLGIDNEGLADISPLSSPQRE